VSALAINPRIKIETENVLGLETETRRRGPDLRKGPKGSVADLVTRNANGAALQSRSRGEENRPSTGILLQQVLSTSHPCNIKPCKVIKILNLYFSSFETLNLLLTCQQLLVRSLPML